MAEIVTIGHSTLSIEVFLKRLLDAGVSMLIDIRSMPYSRFQPHFSQNALHSSLVDYGIGYSFFGDELGGRPSSSHLFTDGIADYEKMAQEVSFVGGINQLIARSEIDNLAVMCSEGLPFDCHRCLLIGRALKDKGFLVKHLTTDGCYITQSEVEVKLLEKVNMTSSQNTLPLSDRLNAAYLKQSRRVAYRLKGK